MNEDLHIEKAAMLADKPAAENLAGDRARSFVAGAMAKKSFFKRRPVFIWSGATVALAAGIAAIFVFTGKGVSGGSVYGSPAELLENQSNHADKAAVDTTVNNSSDTITIESVVYPEE